MGAINITGKSMGSTQATLATGSLSKQLPITVKSTNLLSYGPAEGNNLNVAIAGDGSLSLSSTGDVEVGKGVKWDFPVPEDAKGKTLTLGYDGDIPSAMVIELAADNNSLGAIWQGSNNLAAVVPADATTFELRLLKGGAEASPVEGTLKVRLTIAEGVAWMKPDDTTLQGGGDELADLWPEIKGLPVTDAGITYTLADGGVHAEGVSTGWGCSGYNTNLPLEAGTYLFVSQGSTGNVNSAIQAGDTTVRPQATPVRLEAGLYNVLVIVPAPNLTVNNTVITRLYKL